jgi:uncharacterized membrane protein YfcA
LAASDETFDLRADYIEPFGAPQPRAPRGRSMLASRSGEATRSDGMDGLVERIVVFALAGLASGFVSGLFGVGGGIVRVPLFIYLLPLFGVPHPVLMHVAVGTSMALVLPSALASTRKQLALGNLDLEYFRTWAVGLLAGVLIGIVLLPFISTEVLQAIFAVFMVAIGVYEGFLKDRLKAAGAAPQGAVKLAVAAAIGVVAAMTGTGGGAVTTPALQAFSVRLQSAIAIASAGGLVTGAVATIGAVVNGWHVRGLPAYSLGYVDLAVFAAMVPAILLAAPLGVRAGRRLGETRLRRVYTVLLFVIAFDLIRKLAG